MTNRWAPYGAPVCVCVCVNVRAHVRACVCGCRVSAVSFNGTSPRYNARRPGLWLTIYDTASLRGGKFDGDGCRRTEVLTPRHKTRARGKRRRDPPVEDNTLVELPATTADLRRNARREREDTP